MTDKESEKLQRTLKEVKRLREALSALSTIAEANIELSEEKLEVE